MSIESTQHGTSDSNSGLYVQYGCGICAPSAWLNYDISPTLRLQKIPLIGGLLSRGRVEFPANVQYGDIVTGLPIPAHSCRVVYCSHVLEHLALDDFRAALRNTAKYLKPGGCFRFALPDLEQLAQRYLAADVEQPSMLFMESTILGAKQRPRGLKGAIYQMLGNSRHLWMWDYKSIKVELEAVGFVDVRRAFMGDGNDPMFNEVENALLWGEKCFGVHCYLP